MRKKHFLGLLSVIIVGGLVLAAAVGSSWFTNKNFKSWFNHWGQGPEKVEPTVAVAMETGEALHKGDTYALDTLSAVGGVTFFSASEEVAEQSDYVELNFHAGFDNEYVRGQFIWELGWRDDEHYWVQQGDEFNRQRSVENYIAFVKEDGSLSSQYGANYNNTPGPDTVTVRVVRPFQAGVYLWCAMYNAGGNSNSDITCNIDYLSRYSVRSNVSVFSAQDFSDSASNFAFLDEVEDVTKGSIDGDFKVKQATFSLTDEFKTNVQSFVTFPLTFTDCTVNGTDTAITINGDNSFNWRVPNQVKYSSFISGFDSFNDKQKEAVYYAWYKSSEMYKKSNSYIAPVMNCEAEYTVSLSGVEIYDGTFTRATVFSGADKGKNISFDINLTPNGSVTI